MAFSLTLGNHPSQARHPVTGKPWFDEDGIYVPLFPDQRSIKLDGFVIAYVSADGNIAFLAPFENLPEGCVEEAKTLVAKEFVEPNEVIAPRKFDNPEIEEDDE